jgi:hypothetical protein
MDLKPLPPSTSTFSGPAGKYMWGGGRRAASQRRCLYPQRGAFAQPGRALGKASKRPAFFRLPPSPQSLESFVGQQK